MAAAQDSSIDAQLDRLVACQGEIHEQLHVLIELVSTLVRADGAIDVGGAGYLVEGDGAEGVGAGGDDRGEAGREGEDLTEEEEQDESEEEEATADDLLEHAQLQSEGYPGQLLGEEVEEPLTDSEETRGPGKDNVQDVTSALGECMLLGNDFGSLVL